MKIKLNKKMSLNKSTVANLNNVEMKVAVGGNGTTDCPTFTEQPIVCNPGGTSICIPDTGTCPDDDRTGGACFTRYGACSVTCPE